MGLPNGDIPAATYGAHSGVDVPGRVAPMAHHHPMKNSLVPKANPSVSEPPKHAIGPQVGNPMPRTNLGD